MSGLTFLSRSGPTIDHALTLLAQVLALPVFGLGFVPPRHLAAGLLLSIPDVAGLLSLVPPREVRHGDAG